MAKDLTDETPDRVRLHFDEPEALSHVDDPIHRDLSALAEAAPALFMACDETSGIDRLMPLDDDAEGVAARYGRHEHYELGEIFEDLPGGAGGEADIEGISVDGGWLWVTGSQSLTRGKGDLEERAKIGWDENRQFIGRLPLVFDEDGPRPVGRDGERRAACVKFRKRGTLRKWLKDDPHIAPFLGIPSKENGLDIEGIATSGDRVWLGLRGPVLREYAIILELEMKVTKKGWLKARRLDGKARYRKHLIFTEGQGIRDLARDADDLLILTGTVMAGDGPSQILRWEDALGATASGIQEVEVIADLPYRGAVDHPEGLVLRPDGQLMVVYDSPADGRVSDDPPWVEGDLFAL